MAGSDSYQDLKDLGIDFTPQDKLTQTFNKAAGHIQSIASKLDNANLSLLYGYYKQANEGRCNIPKPGWFDAKGRHKWEAWHKLGDLTSKEAKRLYVETVKRLDGDFDPETTTKEGWVTVSTLQSNADEAAADGEFSLKDYLVQDDVAKVTDILKSYDKDELRRILNEVDSEGLGLIHWAADRGSTSMLRLLLSLGANVNMTDGDGQTPLHYTATCGHSDCIRLLIDYGADPAARDSNGETALDVCDDTTKALFNK